jgi:predicted PurR-regulated permease PerM
MDGWTEGAEAELRRPTTGRMQRRRAHLAFNVLFLVALLLAGYVAWPFRAPLLLAAVLASVLGGVYRRLTQLLRGHRAVAALTTTVGLFALIIGPVAAIVAFLAGQTLKGLAFIHNELGIQSVTAIKESTLSPRAQRLVDQALDWMHLSRAQVDHYAHQGAIWAEEGVRHVLASSSRASFHTAVMLIALYFFLVEGPRLSSWLARVSPLEARQTHELLTEFRNVSRASILGALLAAVFQGVAIGCGFAIAGVPHPVFFGLITLLASFIPIVGTFIVWVPAVAFLWIAGHHGASIVLLIWCFVLVVLVEHIGKPLALRWALHGQEEMHTGLIFLALVGGIEMFGLIGLVLGPLVFALLLAMLRIYERDYATKTVDIH